MDKHSGKKIKKERNIQKNNSYRWLSLPFKCNYETAGGKKSRFQKVYSLQNSMMITSHLSFIFACFYLLILLLF